MLLFVSKELRCERSNAVLEQRNAGYPGSSRLETRRNAVASHAAKRQDRDLHHAGCSGEGSQAARRIQGTDWLEGPVYQNRTSWAFAGGKDFSTVLIGLRREPLCVQAPA
jgi:hypothetical protein